MTDRLIEEQQRPMAADQISMPRRGWGSSHGPSRAESAGHAGTSVTGRERRGARAAKTAQARCLRPRPFSSLPLFSPSRLGLSPPPPPSSPSLLAASVSASLIVPRSQTRRRLLLPSLIPLCPGKVCQSGAHGKVQQHQVYGFCPGAPPWAEREWENTRTVQMRRWWFVTRGTMVISGGCRARVDQS